MAQARQRPHMPWVRTIRSPSASGWPSESVDLVPPPQAEPLELRYEKLLISSTGQTLITYHAQPGSTSEERLRLLASMIAPDRAGSSPAADQPAPRQHRLITIGCNIISRTENARARCGRRRSAA
ncbi:hypothetical protein PV410_38775 [Streptomyces sp. PA03-5A]|nr:hypothetical protein [Streptomyces sp. PA03-5A]